MTTQIQLGAISSSAVSSLQGPRITTVVVTDNTYAAIDDTAVDSTSGGYIKITGSGFVSGCIVTVGNVTATSTTFVSSTEVRAQIGAQAAGSYNLYVSNPDGSLAIKVLGVNYSGIPAWSTSSSQTFTAAAVSFQFTATSDSAVTYSVNAGSSLPGGLSLSSNGLLSGTATGSSGTVYTFTLQATDTENQNTSRTFTVTLSFNDPYFNITTLLIHADGTNAANNNTFIDSSTNNFAITKSGTPVQGSYSPFSQTGWSYFNNGTASTYVTVPYTTANFDWWTGDYTIEAWIYPRDLTNWSKNTVGSFVPNVVGNMDPSTAAITNYWSFGIDDSGHGRLYYYNGGYNYVTSTATVNLNQWNHIGMVKTSSGVSILVNGVATTPTAVSGTPQSSATVLSIGSYNGTAINGYISNLRIVKGTAVYSGTTYTVPSSPLTAITNTKLLTMQSNRFIDNSTNALAHTITLAPSIQSFSPFGGSSVYSTSVVGGSTYFNGSTDYLSIADNANLQFGTGAFTVECWIYVTVGATINSIVDKGAGTPTGWLFRVNASNQLEFSNAGTAYAYTTTTVVPNTWNHVVVLRDASSNIIIGLNGVLSSSLATVTANYTQTSPLLVGVGRGAAANFYAGYISNMRIIKGAAQYSGSTYTVPTAPVTAISGTQFLSDGTNGAIYDQTSKNNLLVAGSTQISTAQYKFGTGSMYFNGTTDYITTTGTSQLMLFGTGAFTIEHWVKFTSTTAYINSIGDNSYFTTTNNFLFMWNYAGAGRLSFWINNAAVCSTTNAYNNDAWHHVAVTRTTAGVITIWVDGVADGTASGYGSTNVGTGSIIIGNQAQVSRYWAGYIDEVRITKGYARYTSNFTPPTLAFNNQ